MFLKPEYLEKVRVGVLLSLVANTGFGNLTSKTSEEIQWNRNEVSLGSAMEHITIFATTTTATTPTAATTTKLCKIFFW
jgi:hypothetical protein